MWKRRATHNTEESVKVGNVFLSILVGPALDLGQKAEKY
jgi:hypothetical protein